jgi:hypothetical protein
MRIIKELLCRHTYKLDRFDRVSNGFGGVETYKINRCVNCEKLKSTESSYGAIGKNDSINSIPFSGGISSRLSV